MARLVPEFSLVFPAYNPGARLDQTLDELDGFVRNVGDAWELVFVADGCTDGTLDKLRRWRPKTGTVRVVDYAPNRGKGYALRQGLIAASGRHRLFTDIDLAYSFEDILSVAKAMQRGAEIVVASRTHPQSELTVSPKLLGYAFRRAIQSSVFSQLVRVLLPVTQKDTQAGLKGLSARAVQQIVPRLNCDGFGIDCEILTACVRFGFSVTEIPVSVRYGAETSTTNFRSTLKMVGDLWRIRRAWPKSISSPPSAMREAA